MSLNLVGLAGVARAGKDTFAHALILRDWKAVAFSSVIKQFYADYLIGRMSVSGLREKVLTANPYLLPVEWDEFVGDVLYPFERHDTDIDAFTEQDDLKRLIRPTLERGGELVYDWVSEEYFRQIDTSLTQGERLVNTRIVLPAEAQRWVDRGGVIYLIERRDWPAATQWEADNLEVLKGSGLITDTFYNHGTAEEWTRSAELFARDIDLFVPATVGV